MSDTERLGPSGPEPAGSSDVPRKRTWLKSPWLWLLVVTVGFTLAIGLVLMRQPERSAPNRGPAVSPSPSPISPDVDEDGLLNRIEQAGWVTRGGATYRTDPRRADTDGDGLTDGDEAGAFVSKTGTTNVYAGYANPLKRDTDGDRLGDGDEADASTNPLRPDSDGDGLSDVREAEVFGTSPVVADTDGDGFLDGFEIRNRAAKGLDPQSVDVKVSKISYATDFAIGAVLGDAWRKDSLAWLLGDLASTGSSYIPVVGPVVGSVADIRDLVASAFRGDWVSSGASATGVVPVVGDTVAIPVKVGKFVDRNRNLATRVASAIVNLDKVPEKLKYKSVLRVHPKAKDLRKAGAEEGTILRLAKGNTNLDDLATAIRRKGHVHGFRTPFFNNGTAGEAFLEKELRRSAKHVTTQISAYTAGCVEVCNRLRRRFDVVADGVAHEAKVGYKRLTPDMARQIESDAFAVKHGDIKGAHWHFFASGTTNQMGADPRLLDYLDKYDIPYTIHMPRAA